MTDHDETTRRKGNAMTPPIYTALFDAIDAAMDDVADMDTTRQDFAKAAAAVMALVSPKPLVWSEASDTDCLCLSDSEYTLKYWAIEKVWVDPYTTMRRHPTLEAAKSAAQAHADAAHWANTVIGAEAGE